jgi:site-specific DNA-methyltransferase (adenine-specific)/adenine-specific DNA-methyltransferase
MTTDSKQQGSLDLPNETTTVENVNEYKFEPIKGYPMLNWRGKRPFTSTQYYPAQLKEVHGEEVDGWRNKIFWGDNLQVMSCLLKEFRGKVDLIYIDPPFDSKADYKKKIKLRNQEVSNDRGTFEEKQYTDIWTNDEYLQFMYERLILLRELLSDRGSIYVHCDQRVSCHLRLMLDEIMGSKNFRGWITWKSSPGHSDHQFYGPMQNHILFYSNGESPIWNQLYQQYDENYLSTHYQKTESDGRRFEDDNLTAYGLSGGGYDYMWNGHRKIWRCPETTMQRMHDAGELYYTKNGVARYKRYLDTMPGVPIPDLWTDLSRLNSQADEKENYPTQKPEALLERIISASSLPSSIVLDCFAGSGTTQVASMKLGRRFLGADINLGAIQTITKRLVSLIKEFPINAYEPEKNIYTGFCVYHVNNYDIFRNPIQAKDILIEALEIQKIELNTVFDGERDGRMVKIMPVNRIATRADLAELIAGFDYRSWERKQNEKPNQPVEKIQLICMGHEPNLKAELEFAAKPFKIDVEVVDILRDKANLEFKRDSEALVVVKGGELIIDRFYPMNLLQKLSLQKEAVTDWREMVESVMIDWNYDGAVLQPSVVDIPGNDILVIGKYKVPTDAGTIRVKITDVLSESWEGGVDGN